MTFLFLDTSGQTVFIRSDATMAEWSAHEMTLTAEFPFRSDKLITRGQRVAFQYLGEWQIFEIRVAKSYDGEYQQITAENIAISELTDDHRDELKLTDQTAGNALQTVLNGTLWAVGNIGSAAVSSADISRGSVWQAVNTIRDNWNVYITPRVALDSSGNITRYLDITPTGGTFNGLYLSADKNITDPCVTWDDSDVITSIKGYGATDTETGQPLTFASVTWEQTADHPAKPAGAVWLTDPVANAEYGRNGRPRCGYYQDSGITDPAVLLQKSWESLRASNAPKFNFDGTVADLYRMGYADQPIRLHDQAIVRISGENQQREIVQLMVDLLNPLDTRPTIGEYIPNIIYINRNTAQSATGSRGGVGGRRGPTATDNELKEFETRIEANDQLIRLEAIQRKNGETALNSKIEITATNIRSEVTNKINGVSSAITQTATQIRSEVNNKIAGVDSRITQTAYMIQTEVRSDIAGLSSRITQTANKVAIVVNDDNSVNSAEIVAGINSQTGSYVKIKADTINLSGYVTANQLSATDAKIDNLMSGNTTATLLKANQGNIPNMTIGNDLTFKSHGVYWQGVTINGTSYHFMGYVG